MVLIAVLVAYSALVVGCVRHVLIDKNYIGPQELSAADMDYYRHSTQFFNYAEAVIEKKKDYTLRRIEFDLPPEVNKLSNDLWRVKIDYYDVGKEHPVPVILVLPPLGGGDEVTDYFAPYFAEHGCAVLVVHRNSERDYIADLEKVEIALRQTIITQMLAIDLAMTRKEFDHKKIGVFGVSMGGIKGALLAALDKRVSSSVLVLAGGDLPYILAHSQESGIANKRQEIMDRYNITPDVLEKKLREKIKTDPMLFAKSIDAKRTLMVLAMFDEIIPIEKGEELAEMIGHPEIIYLPTGHYTAAIFIFYARSTAFAFFNKQFSE
jgi:pimeloyl-ACP methyl ester carboxylesterase